MKKILLSLTVIVLLAAGCDFSKVEVGILKTANGGVDWQPANVVKDSQQSLLNLSISQLKYDTGFNNLYASSFEGGLYKSEDAGENWTQVLGAAQIFDFAFHPTDDKIIYAAGFLNERGRVFVTKDQGKSWTEIYSDAAKQNPVRTVAVNPLNPQEILIGLGRGAIIMSADGGSTWKLVSNYNDRIYRIVWEQGKIYAVVKATGVFMSTDNAQSFKQITSSITGSGNALGLSIFGENISDYRQIAVSKLNPNLIYLTTNNGLYRSFDSGNSWNYISMPYRQQDAAPYAVVLTGQGESVLYVSAGSLVYKSIDGGSTWSTSDTSTNGLVTVLAADSNLPQVAFAGVSK